MFGPPVSTIPVKVSTVFEVPLPIVKAVKLRFQFVMEVSIDPYVMSPVYLFVSIKPKSKVPF